MIRAKLLTLLNQSLSSLTNFGGSALAAGLLTATDFGAFAIAVSVLTIALGLSRTWSGLVLMMTAPGATEADYDEQLSGAVGLSACIGGGAALITAGAGWAVGGSVGTALLALAPLIPIVNMQDAYRFGALSRSDVTTANWNDGAWFVGSIAGLMTLRLTNTDSLSLALLFAVGTAGLGLAVAVRRMTVLPRWNATRQSFLSWSKISFRLSAEFVVAITSNVAVLVIITAWNADLQQAGALRGAQVLLGPLAVLFAASTLYMQPAMVERHRSRESVLPLARRQSIVNVMATVAWVALAAWLPADVGVRIFGASWAGLQDIVVVVGIAFLGLAISSGALTALRSRGQINAGLATQALTALIVLVTTAVGGLLASQGTLRGFAVGGVLASVVAWYALTRWRIRDLVREAARRDERGLSR
jgi:hypothetical protein